MARAEVSSKRMLSLLLAMVLLLVSVYFFGSLVRPAIIEVRGSLAELESKRNFLESQKKARTIFDALKAEYQDAANIQGLLATALPRGADLPQSIHQLQALAGVSGLTVVSISAKADAGALGLQTIEDEESLIKEVKEMRVSLQAVGSYEALKKFLAMVETNIKLMDVMELGVLTNEGGIIYDLLIILYYQE